jgi:hypothetical protein
MGIHDGNRPSKNARYVAPAPLNFSVDSGDIISISSTSASVPYPSDIQAGDLLVVEGLIQSSGSNGSAAGWTNLLPGSGFITRIYKTAVGNETGSLTVSWANSAASCHVMWRIRYPGITPSVQGATGGFSVNPTIVLDAPSASYTKAMHLIVYCDDSGISVSNLDAGLTQLRYRTAASGMWAGWIDTSTLGRVGQTINVSSTTTISSRAMVVYI